MADKVGEGYIEIDARLDERNFVTMSNAVAKRAAQNFGDTYTENVSRSLRGADRQFDTHINRQISSFQALDKQRVAAAEDTARRLQIIQNRIASDTEKDRRISDAYEREGRRAADNFEREQTASFNRIANAHRAGLARLGDDDVDINRRTLARKEVDYDTHGRRGGNIFARHIHHAFEGVLSLLPSRLENVFTRTGPLIGSILFAGIFTAAAIALPALGAMVGAALTASLGVGAAIAAAFVGAADDPRVAASAERIAQTWKDRIIYATETQGIGQALADQLDRVNAALARWAPSINSILNAGARFLEPITTGLIGMVDAVLPAMDRFLNSQFMTDMMNIVSHGIIQIGEAFGVGFDRILNNPQAMEGMKLGAEDFFNLVSGAIKLAFDIIIKMSEAWAELNKDPDGPGPQVSTLQTMRDLWKEVRDLLSEINNLGKEIDNLFGNIFSGGEGGGGGEGATGGIRGELEEMKEQVTFIKDAFAKATDILRQFRSDWNYEMGVLRDNWNSFTSSLKTAWNNTWGAIKSFFVNIWGDITGFFAGDADSVSGRWNSMLEGIKGAWNNAWGFIKFVAVTTWTNIRSFLEDLWIVRFFAAITGIIAELWNKFWTFITMMASLAWGIITEGFRSALSFISDIWTFVWTHVSNFFRTIFEGIVAFAFAVWGIITSIFSTALQGIKNIWEIVWTAVKQFFIDVWEVIKSVVQVSVQWVHDTIVSAMNTIKTAWGSIWGGIRDFMVDIWADIGEGVRGGINFVIGILNKGIGLINAVLEKLGISTRIPEIGLVGGGGTPQPVGNRAVMKADGGYIRGPGGPRDDKIPAYLSNGEYVINAKNTKRFLPWLHMFNNYKGGGGPIGGFAMGGRVGASNNSLLEQHRNHVHVAMAQGIAYIIALAQKSGLPIQVTSTLRPGDRVASGGLSWHASGKAVDFGGFNQDALASYFARIGPGGGLLELIHRTAATDYAFFGGKDTGGLIGIISEWLLKPWAEVLSGLVQPAINGLTAGMPDNGIGWLGKGIGKFLGDQLINWIKGQFDTLSGELFGSGAVGAINAGAGALSAQRWAPVAMRALNMLGLPGSWLQPLLTLIARESGGNPNAINRWDSNAARGTPSMGLMQTIGPTFSAYMYPGMGNILDPLSNILAGLRYIVARYGTIFNVQQANSRMSPAGYANGGVFNPGDIGVNETRKPEAILNQSQWDALANSGGGTVVKVYVDGVEVAHKAVVEKNNKDVTQAFRRGRSVF